MEVQKGPEGWKVEAHPTEIKGSPNPQAPGGSWGVGVSPARGATLDSARELQAG